MKVLKALVVTALLLTAAPAWAHGGESHSPAPSGDAAAEARHADVTNLVARLDSSVGLLEQQIAANAFGEIHKSSEEVAAALQAILAARAEEAAVKATVKQLEAVLEALHTAGDAKDGAAAGREMHKLGGGIKLLKAQL